MVRGAGEAGTTPPTASLHSLQHAGQGGEGEPQYSDLEAVSLRFELELTGDQQEEDGEGPGRLIAIDTLELQLSRYFSLEANLVSALG